MGVVTSLGATNDSVARNGARIKRRPKDRKAQITRAAAETFSAQGYHATSMEAIASKVGISAPALYRHYPSKYEMFAVVVGSLGQQLVDSTAFVDEVSDSEVHDDPAAVLDRIIDGLIRRRSSTARPADCSVGRPVTCSPTTTPSSWRTCRRWGPA